MVDPAEGRSGGMGEVVHLAGMERVADAQTQKMLPVRYMLREDDDGRYLTCVEASNVSIRVERGLSVSLSAARRAPECTIYLDGAAVGEPFMDVKRKVYNLDHHEGCVRSFTLATCEQAMVLVLKGLDLRRGSWTVWANEPDLDTVLAIWLLLNHMRVAGEDEGIRRQLMPVVRLQGVIDSHGLEMQQLCGFPADVREEAMRTIATMRERELALKQSGEWDESDFLDFTLSALLLIDELVYAPHDFVGQHRVEELCRAPLGNDRIALGVRADVGIYEVEEHLREVHGDRIGVVALEKAPGSFTLRQVDTFLSKSLQPIYDRLNQLDSAVDADHRWGGADEIGGSPRGRSTALTCREITATCNWVFQPPRRSRQAVMLAGATGSALLVVLATVVAGIRAWPDDLSLGFLEAAGTGPTGIAGIALGVAAILILLQSARKGLPSLFGVRRPVSNRWLGLLPLVFALALAGGAWVPLATVERSGGPAIVGWLVPMVLAVGAAASELLFRGVLHGRLAHYFAVQQPGGRWFLSVPTIVSAIASATVTVLLFRPSLASLGLLAATAIMGVSALLLGFVCGIARERWGSLWVPMVLHSLAGLAVLLLGGMIL